MAGQPERMPAARWHDIARLAWAAGAVVCVLYLLTALPAVALLPHAWVGSGWMPFPVMSLCALAVGARGRATTGPRRTAWMLLAAGLLLYALATPYRLLVHGLHVDTHFLTVPNVLWLLLGPCALGSIVLKLRARGARIRSDFWVDGLAGGLTVGAAATLLIVKLVIDPTAALQVAPANLTFVLSDLLVVGFGISTFALLQWRPSRPLVVLICGFVALCVEDTLYLGQVIHGRSTTVLDGLWMVAVLAVAAVALIRSPAEGAERNGPPSAPAGVPFAFALCAAGLAVYEGLVPSTSPLPVVLTGLAIVCVALRCALTFRANAQALAAQARSETHLADAQRLARVGSWEWDLRTGSGRWSREMRRLHGWPDDAPPPPPEEFPDLLQEDDGEALHTAYEAVENGGADTLAFEYRVLRPGGVPRLIRAQGTVSRDADGRVVGLFGTCQDVTDTLARAEAERANQAKSEFLSRMSHELRTPLNAVLGFGQLLAADDLTDRQRAKVDHIVSAGRHLVDLVDEILDISRIESGRLPLSLEPVDLGSVIADVVALVRPMAGERNITCATRVEAGAGWVHADQQRLKQVLLNLLSNAVKYNRDGGEIDVVATGRDDRVTVAVRDTGPGIAPEVLPRVFRPFDRLGAERHGVEGTGLGLALSKALVEAMGGTLTVDSVLGERTTFTVELGVAAAPRVPAGTAPGVAAAPAGPARGPGATRRVLCIEDNVSNLDLLDQIFALRPDLELLTAVQASIGLELARRNRPDVVLLDLNLPDMAGDEVLHALRADPATAAIPVIVVSADATARQIERLLAAGARAYVTKPIDVGELLAAVDGALGAEPAGAAG